MDVAGLFGATVAAVVIAGGVALVLMPSAAPQEPTKILARIATPTGGSLVGRLLPMPKCPPGYTCADPDDYQDGN